MKNMVWVAYVRRLCIVSLVSVCGQAVALPSRPLEYNVPVCIRAQEFNRSLAVRAQFTDIKGTAAAAPFELVAVADDSDAARDGSALLVFKSAAKPERVGTIQFNELCTIHAVKAGSGAWADKAGFLSKPRQLWTYPGSKWGNQKGPHYQPRVSDASEPKLKTNATHFAITSPQGKTGVINQNDPVYIVSRASGPANNRMMWVLNLDQDGVLPVLMSSDDPWGRDPKSGLDGDRRYKAGTMQIGTIDPTLLNDAGWADLARVVPQGVAKPGGNLVAGGKSFSYQPAILGKGAVQYSEQWKSDKPGTMWAKFKVRAQSDIMVHLSTQPKWMDAAGTYFILIGGYKNSRSQIRKGTQVVMEVDVAKGGDPAVLISGGLPANGSMWDDYWIEVEQHDANCVISMGKGSDVGQNVKMSWTDEQPLKFVQYLGLGGLETAVDFEKINMSGNDDTPRVPVGFKQIPGTMNAVALGLYEDKPFMLGINAKSTLWLWDSGSLKTTPWEEVEVKNSHGVKISQVVDVAAAADGATAIVSGKRRVYRLNREKGYWEIVPNKLNKKNKAMIDRIALGNNGTLIGLDKQLRNIYFFNKTEWVLLSEGEGLDIAAAFDGSIYALNTKHQLFVHDGKAWHRIESSFAFSMINALSKDELYGIVLDGKTHKTYVYSKGSWEPLQTADGAEAVGVKDIMALPSNPSCMALLDQQGNIFYRGQQAAKLGDVKAGVLTIVVEEKAKAADKIPVRKGIPLKSKPAPVKPAHLLPKSSAKITAPVAVSVPVVGDKK
jgi:hypothetical protein